MCQLSGIPKAGTNLNSTRAADSRLFSTYYSSELHLEHVLLKGGALAFFCDSDLSTTTSDFFLCRLWNENNQYRGCFHKGQ